MYARVIGSGSRVADVLRIPVVVLLPSTASIPPTKCVLSPVLSDPVWSWHVPAQSHPRHKTDYQKVLGCEVRIPQLLSQSEGKNECFECKLGYLFMLHVTFCDLTHRRWSSDNYERDTCGMPHDRYKTVTIYRWLTYAAVWLSDKAVWLSVATVWLSYYPLAQEMDDEEYSYAALQEPLYRLETGNYEYRLILRCRQQGRARSVWRRRALTHLSEPFVQQSETGRCKNERSEFKARVTSCIVNVSGLADVGIRNGSCFKPSSEQMLRGLFWFSRGLCRILR